MTKQSADGRPEEEASKLPETGEVSLMEALSWVAYGSRAILSGPLGRDSPEKIDELDSLHAAWRRENHEMAADWWPSDHKDFAIKLFKIRHRLGPKGRANLLGHLRFAKLDRAVAQLLGKAEAQLLDAARHGLVRMRGCSSELDVEAAEIDPSYFDNRIAIDLLEGGLGFDYRAPLEEWLGRPHPDPLERYRVRVEVTGLKDLVPRPEPIRDASPAEPEQAFEEWAREYLSNTGEAPTVEQCEDWYKQYDGLSREWMRECRDKWPDDLKRSVGQRR